MQFNQLQAFVAVAENSSFSKAAQKLFITQPAMSKRIAQLESVLDTELFQRVGQQVRLSAAGETLLPRAREMVRQWEDCRRHMANLKNEVSGSIRLATSHHVGLHKLAPVLERYRQRYQRVDVDIQFMESESAYEKTVAGDMDLAIITLPLKRHPQIIQTPVWQDPLCFACGINHPLAVYAGSNKPLAKKQLLSFPAVLPQPHTATHALIMRSLGKTGTQLTIKLYSNHLEILKMLVRVNMAWSILPLSMMDESLRNLPVATAALSRVLGMVRHKQRTVSNAARAFMDMLPVLADRPSQF